MKNLRFVGILTLAWMLGSGWVTAQDKPAAVSSAPTGGPAGAVAKVNGKPITRQQLDEACNAQLAPYIAQGQQLPPEQMLGFQRQILGQLIQQELLDQAASKIEVPDLDKKVTEQVASIKARYPNEPEEKIKSHVRQMLTIREFIEQRFGSKITVTDEQIKAFYNEHPDYFQKPDTIRASHILVGVPENATEDVKKAKRAIIDKARERVTKGGEDFAKVAGELSDDPGSKQNGGDLEFFAKGQMVPEFDKVAFELKTGDISEVVTTKFGYHIIKKTGEQPAEKRSLDKSKEVITRFLKERETRKQVTQFLEEQQKAAKIETLLN